MKSAIASPRRCGNCDALHNEVTLGNNYAAHHPFAYALFRASELTTFSALTYARPALEIGCGCGQFVCGAVAGGMDEGLDIHPGNAAIARATGRFGRVDIADARQLPYDDDSFETVFSISVFEHIDRVDVALVEAYRVLRPGGMLVATVVLREIHELSFVSRTLNCCGLSLVANAYRRAFDWVFRHRTMLRRAEWESLLDESGFVEVQTQAVVPADVLRCFELTLPFALPFGIMMRLGCPWFWRPRWLTRILARSFPRMLAGDSTEGACLAFTARKPKL